MSDTFSLSLDLTPVVTALQSLVSASYRCQQTLSYSLANLNAHYLPLSGGTLTGDLTVPSLNTGPLAGLRNQFMNPGFVIAQRGVSFAALAVGITYLSDRWYTNIDGTSTTNVTITAGPIAPLSDNGAQNYLTHQVTVAGTGGAIRNFVQHIEGVWTLSDQTFTVSGWLVADTDGRQVTVTATQVFGTGGSPSANVAATPASVTWSLTTSWARYSATFQAPSVAGKTIGSNNDSYLAIVFGLPLNTAMTISFAGMQCEEGPVATPLEVRPNALEKQMCMRFYQTGTAVLWGYHLAGNVLGSTFALPTPMRAAPTCTFSATTLNNCTGLTYWAALTNTLAYFVTVTAAGGASFQFNYALAADL